MKMRAGNRVVAAALTSALATMAVAAGFLGASIAEAGGPVQYVRLCDESEVGPGFYFLPGSDECYNAKTRQAKQATPGGLWNWRIPANTRQFVKLPKKACKGELIEFGEITPSDLALNGYNRLEASPRVPLALAADEYVSAVIYEGGFMGTSDFCTFYYYDDAILGPVYTPLGCMDTFSLLSAGATATFVPDAPRPPATANPISIAVANGFRATSPTLDGVQGSLSVWLCVQQAR